VTSPHELPPPSPASSIGSSAGSLTNGNTNGSNQPSQSSQASEASSQQTQVEIMHKMVSLYERFSRLNDYNLRSQNFWESNETQINEIDYLNGKYKCSSLFRVYPGGVGDGKCLILTAL
jgi:hypothetical protein